MRRLKGTILAAASAALLLAGCTKGGGEIAGQPEAGAGADKDWPTVGGGADESSYSRLEEIGTGNVGKLGLAWSLDLPGEVTLEGTPIAVDGKLYFSGSYAAVYAVGPKEWPHWEHLGLDRADGTPWALGDFPYVLDPAAPQWLDHFTADLTAAMALGFDGFHLDQYGWPKRALRRDGVLVDVGQSFVTMLEGVRAALPSASLVFNNVNDFPTRLTADTAQDALYIEPWEPQLTLQSLADTVTVLQSGQVLAEGTYDQVRNDERVITAYLGQAG